MNGYRNDLEAARARADAAERAAREARRTETPPDPIFAYHLELLESWFESPGRVLLGKEVSDYYSGCTILVSRTNDRAGIAYRFVRRWWRWRVLTCCCVLAGYSWEAVNGTFVTFKGAEAVALRNALKILQARCARG